MKKSENLAERRAFIWNCLSKFKMSNAQAREATRQKFQMQSFPQRTFEYDLTTLRKERREKLNELVTSGMVDEYWSTLDSLKACIQDLQVIVASSATSPRDKIDAIDSIATIEVYIVNLTAEETVKAVSRVKLEGDRLEEQRRLAAELKATPVDENNFTGTYGR